MSGRACDSPMFHVPSWPGFADRPSRLTEPDCRDEAPGGRGPKADDENPKAEFAGGGDAGGGRGGGEGGEKAGVDTAVDAGRRE